MIQDIENFKPDLGIEGLGNFSDVVVFEDRKVQIHKARSDQDVATGIAKEVVIGATAQSEIAAAETADIKKRFFIKASPRVCYERNLRPGSQVW